MYIISIQFRDSMKAPAVDSILKGLDQLADTVPMLLKCVEYNKTQNNTDKIKILLLLQLSKQFLLTSSYQSTYCQMCHCKCAVKTEDATLTRKI